MRPKAEVVLQHCRDCPVLLQFFNSCPLLLSEENIMSENPIVLIWDLIMVLVSIMCYLLPIMIICHTIITRTNRGFCLSIIVLGQFLLTEILKKNINQKRPDHSCRQSNGFPSGHTSFVGAYVIWLFQELLCLDPSVLFKYDKWYKLQFYSSVILGYMAIESRLYLNYHTNFQVNFFVSYKKRFGLDSLQGGLSLGQYLYL